MHPDPIITWTACSVGKNHSYADHDFILRFHRETALPLARVLQRSADAICACITLGPASSGASDAPLNRGGWTASKAPGRHHCGRCRRRRPRRCVADSPCTVACRRCWFRRSGYHGSRTERRHSRRGAGRRGAAGGAAAAVDSAARGPHHGVAVKLEKKCILNYNRWPQH